MPPPSILQCLKERKLVQWGLAYLAGGFVVFQAVEVMAEPWGISPALQRAVHIVLFIGLFIALVLAWYHGEKGRQWASGPELLMITVLLVIAGTGLSLLRRTDTEPGVDETVRPVDVEDERPSIAVLPFENDSPDPTDAYFADGMQEEIISRLARISALKVTSRNSTMQYREERKQTPQIAAELDVDFLLEGSARIAGDQVRLTAQLIDARRDEHLWLEVYDQELSIENLISTQSDIAQRVAQEIGAWLTPEERDRVEKRPTTNLDAYDLYLLGRNRFSTRSPETIREAIDYFEAAIELDSTFALAFSGVADAYMILPQYDLNTEPLDVYEQAKAAATRAFELDPSLGEVHASLGLISLHDDLDWEAAERYLSSAVELAPGYPWAHHWYSNFLGCVGRKEEALAEIEEALSLDPRSNVLVWLSAVRLHSAGRIVEARERYEQAIAMEPPYPFAFESYGLSLAKVEPTDPVRAGDLFVEFARLYDYPFPDGVAGFVETLLESVLAIGVPAPEAQAAALSLLDDLVQRTQLDRGDIPMEYCNLTPVDVCFSVLEEA